MTAHISYYSVVEREANLRREKQRQEDELKLQAKLQREHQVEVLRQKELERAVLRIQSRFRGKPENGVL